MSAYEPLRKEKVPCLTLAQYRYIRDRYGNTHTIGTECHCQSGTFIDNMRSLLSESDRAKTVEYR